MIKYYPFNEEKTIFNSNCDIIVNTVNCLGIMGTGLAAEFKTKFPEMFKDYKSLCRANQIKIGKLWVYDKTNPKIMAFPTKDDWKKPSQYTFIEKGLQEFVRTYESLKINSIAFPILGARNGCLDKLTVRNMMYEYLDELPIHIEIYDTIGV